MQVSRLGSKKKKNNNKKKKTEEEEEEEEETQEFGLCTCTKIECHSLLIMLAMQLNLSVKLAFKENGRYT